MADVKTSCEGCLFQASPGNAAPCNRCGLSGRNYDLWQARPVPVYDMHPAKAHQKEQAKPSGPDVPYSVESGWPALPALKTQIGGDHYLKMGIQPFEYSFANNLGPAEHTVVKYVTRWKDKGGIEDLRKAKQVLDILIEHTEKAAA